MWAVAITLLLWSGAWGDDPPRPEHSLEDIQGVEAVEMQLPLPHQISDAQWAHVLDALKLKPGPELQDAWSSYTRGWADIKSRTSGLPREAGKASGQVVNDRFAALKVIYTKCEVAYSESDQLQAALLEAVAQQLDPSQTALFQSLKATLEVHDSFRVFKMFPLWAEAAKDPIDIVERLADDGVDLSPVRPIVEKHLSELAPSAESASRALREWSTKDQGLMHEHQMLLATGTPEALTASERVLERRGQSMKPAIGKVKAVRNSVREFVQAAADALPDADAEKLRTAFESEWHPKLAKQRVGLRAMFPKAKSVWPDSATYSELVDACASEFETAFDAAVVADVKLSDAWVERRLRMDAIANSEREAYEQQLKDFEKARFEIGRKAWTRMLDALDPEKRAELEKWMSPNASPSPRSQ